MSQISQLAISFADTFVTKACFNCFFLHQTQRKRDSNVHEKAWRTLFTVSPDLEVSSRPSTQEVGCEDRLAADVGYTRSSTDSYSSLLSLHIRISLDPNRLGPNLFSLINPQQSVQMRRTEPNRRQNPGPASRCRYRSACFLRCVVELGSAVIVSGAHLATVCSDCSGAHVTMVAMVDNASRIRKAFMK